VRMGLCIYSFAAMTRAEREMLGGLPVPRDWTGLMDLAAACGLSGVECHLPPGAADADLDRLREAAAERGLYLTLAGGRVTTADGPALLRAAHRLGAATVRMVLSGVLEGDRGSLGPGGWHALREASAERLREWRPLAEDLGVNIGIENHQDAGSDDLLWLCERVGGDRIGVTLDTGNPLAVGEDPVRFARRIAPCLKNVHLKDYQICRSASGYRLVRCAVGAGVIDFPALFELFAREAPGATCNLELGATKARHIRLLTPEWWEHFPARDVRDVLSVLQLVARCGRPEEAEWRTPHEQEAPEAERVAYELAQFRESICYLTGLFAQS
jgi:sugar phosphate isomerase/epimerase